MNVHAAAQPTVEATLAVVIPLIHALVDDPAAVKVSAVTGAQAVVFEVEVAPSDVRRIIGRKGRTADALREIFTNLGGKAQRRYLLEIIEPAGRPRAHQG